MSITDEQLAQWEQFAEINVDRGFGSVKFLMSDVSLELIREVQTYRISPKPFTPEEARAALGMADDEPNAATGWNARVAFERLTQTGEQS